MSDPSSEDIFNILSSGVFTPNFDINNGVVQDVLPITNVDAKNNDDDFNINLAFVVPAWITTGKVINDNPVTAGGDVPMFEEKKPSAVTELSLHEKIQRGILEAKIITPLIASGASIKRLSKISKGVIKETDKRYRAAKEDTPFADEYRRLYKLPQSEWSCRDISLLASILCLLREKKQSYVGYDTLLAGYQKYKLAKWKEFDMYIDKCVSRLVEASGRDYKVRIFDAGDMASGIKLNGYEYGDFFCRWQLLVRDYHDTTKLDKLTNVDVAALYADPLCATLTSDGFTYVQTFYPVLVDATDIAKIAYHLYTTTDIGNLAYLAKFGATTMIKDRAAKIFTIATLAPGVNIVRQKIY